MRKSIFVFLSAATLLAAPSALAADLSYSGHHEHGVQDDWTGDDASEAPSPSAPDEEAWHDHRRHHQGGREVVVVVRNTVVTAPAPVYGWPAYAAYPNIAAGVCTCVLAGPSGAYAAGYAYGYAHGYEAPGYGYYGGY